MTLSDRIRNMLSTLDGVIEGASIFGADDGDRGWFVDGRQVAHFIDDDVLEIRLTKAGIAAQKARFVDDPRVLMRKSASDWLAVRFASPDDLALVEELAGAAALAHRPSEGAVTRLPPAGADLERRRRFH